MTLHVLFKQVLCHFCTSQKKSCINELKDFMKMSNKPMLFHSLPSILSVFENPQNKTKNGVQELLDIFYQKKNEFLKCNNEKKYPFIVLEGLDGCGKTSVGRRYAAQIGALQWKTPPQSISHLRDLFDENGELRTAFYSLGNYVAAYEIQGLLHTSPVLMDRYWHSTAAYAIAQSIQDYPELYKLPPPLDKIFVWPEDLFKPDIVIFLNVSEEIRMQRQSRRTHMTPQEQLLNNCPDFRNNVVQIYKSMQNPEVVFINGDVSFSATIAQIEAKTKHLFKK